MIRYLYIYTFVFFSQFCFGQNDNLKLITIDTVDSKINPLAPAKAAFYSALLPGLGQAYNKKYWKIPIVWGAIGTGVGVYFWNQNKYTDFRNAYKQRLLFGDKSTDKYNNPNGITLTLERLERGQKFHQRNRDLSLLVTVGLYVLNIIDANVDGHLKQFNVNDKLTLKPEIIRSNSLFETNANVGLGFQYKF